MGKPVASYDELLERLDKLSQPKPGFVRVFRGQTAHFKHMLPSALRAGGVYRRHVWLSYMEAMARVYLK